MDYEKMKDKIYNKKFIGIFIFIMIILFAFCSFVKFLGQWPILLIISFLLAYYLNYQTIDFTK